MNLENEKSAIVLIEIQKQWTQKGIYHWLIKGQLKKRNALQNSQSLVKKARSKGFKIIHAPLIIDPKNKKGWLAYLTFGNVFRKGSWKSELSEGVYESEDHVVRGRYAFNAFTGSDLEDILKDINVKNIFFCGFTTDQCVAKTMRTALDKGFNCYLVSDCTAAMNGFFQWKTERKFRGKIVNHKEILNGF